MTRPRRHLLLLVLATFGLALTAHAQRVHRISGVVYDSIAKSPLRNAVVQLVKRENPALSTSVRSDARGLFAFDTIVAGRYMIGFHHPRLDSLLLTSPLHAFEVANDDAPTLQLYVPTQHTLAYALCGEAAHRDSTGVMLGHVRPSRAGERATRSQLRVQWSEFVVDTSSGARTRFPTMLAQTNDDGAFAICGLPVNTRFLVQSWTSRDTSGVIEVDMPLTGLAVRDIFVGAFDRITISERAFASGAATRDNGAVGTVSASADTSGGSVDTTTDSITVVRGNGRLRGVILTDRLVPLANARVSVRESGVVATTNDAGLFTLQSLPTGSHLLETTAIGYAPSRRSVNITELSDAPVDVVMERLTRGLDTLRVFSTRGDRWKVGFNLRRQIGLGRFADEEQIEKMNPMFSSDIVRLMPSVVVKRVAGSLQPLVLMRTGNAKEMAEGAGTDPELCAPTLYIDGALMAGFNGSLEQMVTAREIRAIEVYRSAALAPAELQPQLKCGVIAVWTGMRKPLPAKR